jgi:hypothetical protein
VPGLRPRLPTFPGRQDRAVVRTRRQTRPY